ncbi:MAG: glycosyltransferase family 4 protein [Planctomycetes bacterium]|nr:glycosyltransferase family 4 protein [Planctomycetota bacterium]
MKIALITTPAGARSGIGDYTRHLLPALRESAEVDLYVEAGRESHDERSVNDLAPREYDQLLYQLGNERQHAFMAPLIRALGGTVMLHDWVLFDLALAAWPELERGGLRGSRRAWIEGGFEQWRILREARRGTPDSAPGPELTIAGGWHDAERAGRWCADRAQVVLGAPTPDALELDVVLPAGRTLEMSQGGPLDELAGPFDGVHAVPLRPGGEGVLDLRVTGIAPTPEQQAHGDTRRLGLFLRSLRVRRDGEWEALQLSAQPPGAGESGLSRARFDLPLNRTIVREADAFLVHNQWMADKIRADRNAPTPIAVVHHGADRRWRDGDRRLTRVELGLPPKYTDSFLLVSLGAVQAHKRVGPLLEGLALARRTRPELRLVLVGEERPREFDLRMHARRLGLEDAVHCTGYVEEAEAWDLLSAADLAVNLRGPTSGGASGGVFQAFSLGRSALITDAPQAREIPADTVRRVALGASEVDDIAKTLSELATDPAHLRSMESAVRRFVEDECHWSHVAARYLEAMSVFPAAKCAKKNLFRLVADYGEKQAAKARETVEAGAGDAGRD